MANRPLISVLMPVYNAASFIRTSVESVLTQSYDNFELVIIDDGSSDSSPDILRGFSDSRIRIFSHSINRGLATCLNQGIEKSQGELIARMDADDRCFPKRFELQVSAFQKAPMLGLCGTWANIMGSKTKKITPPTGTNEIKAGMLFDNRFIHPSAMIRRSALNQRRLRYQSVAAEDYLLFSQLLDHSSAINLPYPLIEYRIHADQLTLTNSAKIKESADHVRQRELKKVLPLASPDQIRSFQAFSSGDFTITDLPKILQLLSRILEENRLAEIHDPRALTNEFRKKSGSIYHALKKPPSKDRRKVIFEHRRILELLIGKRRWCSLAIKNYKK